MSGFQIEYKRFSTKMVDDVKEFFDKFWKRSIAEIDMDYMDYDDIRLLQETSKMVKRTLDESKDYIEVMNYQVRLLEDIEMKLKEMDERLEKIEKRG